MSRRPQDSWLRVRLWAVIALGLVVVALPVAAGSAGILQVRKALVDRVTEGQLVAARAVALDIGRSIEFPVRLTRSAARRPGLMRWVQEGNAEEQRAVLVNIFETSPLFLSVAVYGPDGRLLASHPRAPTGLPDDVLAGSEPRQFQARPREADAVLTVREPVGPAGAVLIAQISFTLAVPEIRTLRFGRTGSVTLVDREASVLVTGEAARVGGRLQSPENRRLVRQWREGTSRYYGPLVERREVAAFVPVPERPWAVLMTQSEAEAFQPVVGLERGLVAGLGLLVAAGSLIALLMWQTLRRYDTTIRRRIDEQRRLNTALEDFASRVAHDLRSPLGTIRMASQVATADPDLPERARASLEMIDANALRGIALVQDLLALAQASGTPRLQRVDLGGLIAEAAEGIDHLELNSLVPDYPMVADPTALRQAFVNLFTNAVKYAQVEGVARVTVEVEPGEAGHVIRVSDRGPGLPPEEAVNIFEPFTRGEGRGLIGGTGLGLAIVAAMAEAHGGSASYEPSEGGGGATFVIRLPRVSLDSEEVREPGRRVPTSVS